MAQTLFCVPNVTKGTNDPQSKKTSPKFFYVSGVTQGMNDPTDVLYAWGRRAWPGGALMVSHALRLPCHRRHVFTTLCALS